MLRMWYGADMATAKSEQLVVRLDPDMRTGLEQHAAEHERTLSQTIRLAVREFLTREQP